MNYKILQKSKKKKFNFLSNLFLINLYFNNKIIQIARKTNELNLRVK